MKKLFLCSIIFILFLTGCTKQSEMNTQQILKGDFSSVAGVYINSSGQTIKLDRDGLRKNEVQTSEIRCYEDGSCSMGIHPKDQLDAGYALFIYPPGTEIYDLKTDTTKVRIYYGQAEPLSETEIYTKIDETQSSDITPQQAFVEKDYLSLLNEYALQHEIDDFTISEHQISLTGDIKVDYDYTEQLYTLIVSSDTAYIKDNESKNAHLVITTTCSPEKEIMYDAVLTTSDDQTFYLGFSSLYNAILNNDDLSEEKGNAMAFVTPLHMWILSSFKEAETITTLQYTLLTAWYQQQTAVQQKIKAWNQIISAHDIVNSFSEDLDIPLSNYEQHIFTFFNKGYWNLIEKASHSSRLTGITMNSNSLYISGNINISYNYDDELYNLIIDKEIHYTKNNLPKSGTLHIAYILQNDDSHYGGFFTLPDGQVFYLMYDSINNILLDNETGSATLGQPTKFVSSLNDALVEEFKKACLIAAAQYPVLTVWDEEITDVKRHFKDINQIREADTIEIDSSLLKNEPHCTGTLVEQGELLTEMFLDAYQYSNDFNGLKNENMSAEYYMDDLLPYKDNSKHPYAYLVNQNSEGYYHFYFSDLQKMNRELFGEEKELTHYTEGIITNTSMGRYETTFEFGHGESIGPGYDVLWIQSYEVDDMIQVDFELKIYLFENHESTGETQSKLGTSYYNIINENGHVFLRHMHTDLSK